MKRCDSRGKDFHEVIQSVGAANGQFEQHFDSKLESMWTSIERADERVDEATHKINQTQNFVKKLDRALRKTEQAVSGLTAQLADLNVRVTNKEAHFLRHTQAVQKLGEEISDLATRFGEFEHRQQRNNSSSATAMHEVTELTARVAALERRNQPKKHEQVKKRPPPEMSESLEALARVGINVMDPASIRVKWKAQGSLK